MRQRNITLGLFTVLWASALGLGSILASPVPAAGQSVSIVRLTPPSPASLAAGEQVKIDFRYDVRAQAGYRIFIRPMSGSGLAARYSASGSPLFSSGSGTGSAHFTLREAGRVDRLRIVVSEEGTGRHLHRSYFDVDYRFGLPLQVQPGQILEPAGGAVVESAREWATVHRRLQLSEQTLERLGTYQPPVWRPLPDAVSPEPPNDDMPQCFAVGIEPKPCEQVAGRRVTADGVVILDCVDGSTWRTTAEGDVFTTPDGRSCRHAVMAYRMGTALPPAEPPDGVSAAQWAAELNAWLDQSVASNLLFRIELLLGDEYFANYQQLELAATDNLYQQIDYRLAFLDKLMEGQ
ncbi:MAG: hypothetical protein MPN21_17485 [Thermoanaerobaculia bacterium]|nr:hypothetical protein [Thermoanaerobaculia bacterium]